MSLPSDRLVFGSNAHSPPRFADWKLAMKTIFGFWAIYCVTIVARAFLGSDPGTVLANKVLTVSLGIVLTILLYAAPLNPNSIGIRVPNCSIAQEILKATGALATTSANLSGEDALTDMSAIASKFPSVYVLDDENTQNAGVASTVIKWTGKTWEILRQGKLIIPSLNQI